MTIMYIFFDVLFGQSRVGLRQVICDPERLNQISPIGDRYSATIFIVLLNLGVHEVVVVVDGECFNIYGN